MANINSLSNAVFVLVTVLPYQPNENHQNDKLLGSQVCINVEDIDTNRSIEEVLFFKNYILIIYKIQLILNE